MRFHYHSYGKGHPLVILHGLLGSADNWATIGKRLGLRFHVFAFDARNHGRSFHSSIMHYEAMASDVERFMHQHGITSAHLLGHSMGGKTAMHFALTAPDRCNKLVIVDIAPRAYGRKHDHIFEALCAINLREHTQRKEIEHPLSERIAERETVQFLLKNLARDEEGRFKWKMNLAVLKKHYAEISGDTLPHGHFDKPVVFIKGGKSGYISEEDRPRIKSLFPRANILTIKRAGHWVHADAPDELEKIVVKFLG